MLKIGVLTYHRSINYGAVWQAISLKDALSDNLNSQVKLIDVVYRKVQQRDGLFAAYKKPWQIPYRTIRNWKFKSFLKEHGSLTSKLIISNCTEKMNDYIRQQELDYIIVGSDEVWKINNLRPYNNIYWLNNLPDIYKMSYAASANGTNFEKVTEKQKQFIQEALKDFKCVSVRDFNTKQFLISCGCKNKIIFSNDPAFLCNLEKYKDNSIREHFTKIIRSRAKERKVMGVMVRSHQVLKQIYQKYRDEYFIVNITGNSFNSHMNCSSLSPIEWINIFSCFDFIVTNFFHGAVFSMLNQKPFAVIDAKEEYKNYESKIEYLMKSTDISNYYFNLYKENFKWDNVYRVISSMEEKYPFEKIDSFISETHKEFKKYVDIIGGN